MLKSTISSGFGFVILLAVVFVSILERGQTEIRFIDWHAAFVVLGGVCGSLLMALKGSTFLLMARDWLQVIVGRDSLRQDVANLKLEAQRMETAWKAGKRGEVMDFIEKHPSEEIRVAAEALVQHSPSGRLTERFEFLRSSATSTYLPQIEGWDLIARLAPSFGIVGTVAGMVQLFRNMANASGNLGGAMALALLATLYGILLGTAVGGPMSTRLNQIYNDRMGIIDLLERQVAALGEEDRQKRRPEAQA